jgi:ABC-type Fe3+-hydroxamate transport system substrate-binding protein
VDYQTAENQAIQLQQQANQVTQRLKDVADKLQAKIPDPNLSRELMLDLREVAIALQQQNQSAVAIIQQMAQYIHALESNLASAPQASFQPRGWYTQPYPTASGGFMGNVVSGLGMGAGFGLAESLVEDIFGRW